MNNQITLSQWDTLINTIKDSPSTKAEHPEVLYIQEESFGQNTRHSVYDNFDRYYIPGLDLIISPNSNMGTLTVYNGSEQARAPISFDDALLIAQNFFSEYGGHMAEQIVCDWIMNGNDSVF